MRVYRYSIVLLACSALVLLSCSDPECLSTERKVGKTCYPKDDADDASTQADAGVDASRPSDAGSRAVEDSGARTGDDNVEPDAQSTAPSSRDSGSESPIEDASTDPRDTGIVSVVDASLCNPSACQNGSTCAGQSANCACTPGFSGVHCETNIDDCPAGACSPGTCQDGLNTYSCVCGSGYFAVGQTCARFRDNGNGSVVDATTNLAWQQTCDGNTYTFEGAKTFCYNLTTAGARWRLPTITELTSIVDTSFDPVIDPTYFKGTPTMGLPSIFWSSTSASMAPAVDNSGVFQGYSFEKPGQMAQVNGVYNLSVRCVH